MSAKWYIEVDSYWQNSKSVFIGPFRTREEAENAAAASDAVPADSLARDVFNNVRYHIRNTGQARRLGMNENNTVPPSWSVPNNTQELFEMKQRIIWD